MLSPLFFLPSASNPGLRQTLTPTDILVKRDVIPAHTIQTKYLEMRGKKIFGPENREKYFANGHSNNDGCIVSKKCGPVNTAVMLHDSAASSDIRSEK